MSLRPAYSSGGSGEYIQLWDYMDSRETVLGTAINSVLPADNGDFQGDVVYQNRTPQVFVNLVAENMTQADRDREWIKTLTRGVTYTYTMVDGVQFTGVPFGQFKDERSGGSIYSDSQVTNSSLFKVTIRVKVTNVTALIAALTSMPPYP